MHFLTWTVLCVPILFSSSCNKSTSFNHGVVPSGDPISKNRDNYDHVYLSLSNMFLDRPDTETLRRLLTKVLPLYGYDINEKNLKEFGAGLTRIRRASDGQVRELDILEEMAEGEKDSLKGRLD
jgi:hypothetical protein